MDWRTAANILVASMAVALVVAIVWAFKRNRKLGITFCLLVGWCFLFDRASGLHKRRADFRCVDIAAAGEVAPLLERREGRFQSVLERLPGYDTMSAATKVHVLRIIRAQDAAEMHASDSTWADMRRSLGDSYAAEHDSAAQLAPPPRPSEMAWYNENCYQAPGDRSRAR
jgi:hypothetical protein